MQNKRIKILNILYPIIAILAILLLWYITSIAVGVQLLVPSVGSTFAELGRLFASGQMYIDVGWTLLRTILSFLLALALGLALALLANSSKVIEKLLHPLVVIMRVVPSMSIILIAIIWLTGAQVPLLVSFVIIFPMLYSSFLLNLQGVDKELLQMSKVFRVSRKKTILQLYLPQLLPRFFDDSGTAISLNFKLIISAEVLAQTRNSIGVNMQFAKQNLETAQLIAWTIVAIVIGALLELLVFGCKKAYERCAYEN